MSLCKCSSNWVRLTDFSARGLIYVATATRRSRRTFSIITEPVDPTAQTLWRRQPHKKWKERRNRVGIYRYIHTYGYILPFPSCGKLFTTCQHAPFIECSNAVSEAMAMEQAPPTAGLAHGKVCRNMSFLECGCPSREALKAIGSYLAGQKQSE